MMGALGAIGSYYNQNAISYAQSSVLPDSDISKISPTSDASETKKAGRTSSPADCQTCKERKYQDGSDEMVSFKSASHISPEASMAPLAPGSVFAFIISDLIERKALKAASFLVFIASFS